MIECKSFKNRTRPPGRWKRVCSNELHYVAIAATASTIRWDGFMGVSVCQLVSFVRSVCLFVYCGWFVLELLSTYAVGVCIVSTLSMGRMNTPSNCR